MSVDDEPRWLLAVISDTGIRLAEACGLLRSDIKLNDKVPHVVIREHPWRRLKTSSSNREIPLVGAALLVLEPCTVASGPRPKAVLRVSTRPA